MGSMQERSRPMTTRRVLMQAAAGLAIPAEQLVTVKASARPGAPFHADRYGTIGVFGIDWLLDPRFTSLLDNLAASPGAVRGVRTFGALSGGRDKTFPTLSSGVWDQADRPADFSRSLAALEALVSRGLTPFLPLTFFPPTVSTSPTMPPPRLDQWQRLVRAFLDAVNARFGAAEVARWWFEVWNEPNMPPFWAGSFDRYLQLYRATSDAVLASGHQIRLGGPVIAYLPVEGPALIEQFLHFLRDAPGVKCDFISLHRKGAWTDAEGAPELGRLVDAATATARAVLRLVPGRARGLAIVNDEADMQVGFDQPFPPRMTAQSASWLAASMAAHERLGAAFAGHGLRFVAASDNANSQLAQAPFDGRRMLMTPLSAAPADQIKLPVLGFYELLRLMGDRHGTSRDAPDGVTAVVTVSAGGIAALFTRYRDAGETGFECVVHDVPWRRVNVVQFRIDTRHTNAARGGPSAGQMRLVQELGVLAPPRFGQRARGTVCEPVRLGPFDTALVWITPYQPMPPGRPRWLETRREAGNIVLRWTANGARSFYSYEVSRSAAGMGPVRISPDPLRAGMWIDTAAPDGLLRYAVRAVTASGVPGQWAVCEIA
jgi:hypothetical protein